MKAVVEPWYEDSREWLHEAELLDMFRALFNWQGKERLTAKQWAKDNGFSQAYVSDLLHGRRGVADRFAEALGYRRVVTFVPVPAAQLTQET